MSGLLRICTAGSVDDGKSTLIGRLLYDSRSVYEDQLHADSDARRRIARPARSISRCSPTGCAPNANRASPSTSPIATSRRPGASSSSPTRPGTSSTRATWRRARQTADVAILLVDARHGVRPQSRRHAQIARLLGIKHYVLAVNKMDLVDFDRGVFNRIVDEFDQLLAGALLHPDSDERPAR